MLDFWVRKSAWSIEKSLGPAFLIYTSSGHVFGFCDEAILLGVMLLAFFFDLQLAMILNDRQLR